VMDVSPSTKLGSARHVDLAAGIKRVLPIPVIAVGGMNNPDVAERTLAQNKADFVAVGRAFITDALWLEKVRSGRLDAIIPCIECNELCLGNLSKNIPITCTQNPDSGQEYLKH